ncbi:unnamed protein product [Penicillium salamii]|uniref:Uncharacterized protein n=1 Tax=Penicillium salamii TaxID=1612424 RepID=A0A9W4JGV3_9EURO|nr:unnamed protein product [Penicillium salamii]CAG8062374.1 unnamed protein product [Penicillium salamii]CAG8139876.1 unnamed protein product [Penicillium salamii]CAG8149366.1 unnamed protein product [Penicillium salamii]CAG8157480.1 unnamed protein product [Penicillium salamii]
MANLPEIRREILENDTAKRIVLKLKTERLDSQDYRTSAKRVVSEIFPDLETDTRIRIIVIDVWTERTFIVIDINRHDYDFETADEDKTILPVSVLRQHGRRKNWVLVRWPREDENLATQVANLHRLNGFEPTPFLQDHNTRICYANPRNLSPRLPLPSSGK